MYNKNKSSLKKLTIFFLSVSLIFLMPKTALASSYGRVISTRFYYNLEKASKIQGTVYDKFTNRRLANAYIHLIPLINSFPYIDEKKLPSTKTDNNGNFTLTIKVQANSYCNVRASKSGYGSAYCEIYLKPMTIYKMEFYLEDNVPPTGTITINNGDEYARNSNVILTLRATDTNTGINQMKFSNDGNSWTQPISYSTSKQWTLTSGDGQKTVSVKFSDRAGNWSRSHIDTIILDTTPPQNPSIIIQEGEYTNRQDITLQLSADGANEMIISENQNFNGVQWEQYQTPRIFRLSTNDGPKVICIKYRDRALNETQKISKIIVLDTIPPQNLSISVAEGEEVNNYTIHLILHADGASRMKISEAPDLSNTNWQEYSESYIFNLSGGLGEKNIYAKFKDNAGNETNVVSCSVILRKPVSQGPVKVIGRELWVNDSRYIIKGFTYQPIPVGSGVMYERVYENSERDFVDFLAPMGCNTVRTYRKVNEDILNAAEAQGIKVIAGFPIPNGINFSDNNVREDLIDEFRDYVDTFKDYEAILIWAIGNEQNYFNGNIGYFYSLANEMAKAAFEAEGDSYHPVAIVNGDLDNIGRPPNPDPDPNISYPGSDDNTLNYIDIWGVNIYRGYTFVHNSRYTDFFQDCERVTTKPIWISECGIDAWDNVRMEENQKRQAAWDSHNWDEIAENLNVCAGVTFMSYSDEWWKATGGFSIHNYGGYSTDWSFFRYHDAHPDHYSNEEWWGIMKWDGNYPNYSLLPRMAYFSLMKRWMDERTSLTIDDFEDGSNPNLLGGNLWTFDSNTNPNDYCYYLYSDSDGRKCGSITYDVSGPGSWSGFGTDLRNTDLSNIDARRYDNITFYIKGETGGEMCKIGLKDINNHEAKINFSDYLPHGVTTDWQEVSIPLTSFGGSVDLACLSNVSIAFVNEINSGNSTIYIDDLKFEIEDYRNLTPLIAANFNSIEAHRQNALGFAPVVLSGSINTEVDLINSPDATPCLRFEYGQDSRWLMGLFGIDVSPYKHFSITVKGIQGGEKFHIYLEDKWHNRNYMEIDNITTDWQTINIPLYEFVLKGVDITCLINLEIVSEWGNPPGTVLLDNIQFSCQ